MTMASFVKKNSKKSDEILDLNTFDQDQFENKLIINFMPNVIGYSCPLMFLCYLESLIKLVKKILNKIIQIAGGPAASTAIKKFQMNADLDVCWSEGELALTRLLDSDNLHLELEKDPWIQKANMDKKVPRSFVTEDLDNVIDIDYKLVDVSAYNMKEAFSPFVFKDKNSKQFFIVTSRGCPFKCNFCAEPTFHGNGMRYASTQKVYEHVKKLVDEYSDSFNNLHQILMNKKRAKELLLF